MNGPPTGTDNADQSEGAGRERPAVYSCRHHGCDKSFPRRDYRDRHEANHLQNRPYKCDECDKAYYRLDVLVRHQRTHHNVGGGSKSSTPHRQRATPQAKRKRRTTRDNTSDTRIPDEELETPRLDTSAPVISPQIPDPIAEAFTLSSLLPIDVSQVHLNHDPNPHDDRSYGSVGQEHEELMRLILPAKSDQPFYSNGTDVIITPSVSSELDHENDTAGSERFIENMCRQVMNSAAMPLDPEDRALLDRFLVPSYLDLCIELYFLHFEPIRPIIHRPTLLLHRDDRALPWLITAMVFIGSACSNEKDEILLLVSRIIFPKVQRVFSVHLRDVIRDLHLRELQAALLFTFYGLHYSSQDEHQIALAEWPSIMEHFRLAGLWHTRLESSRPMDWTEWASFEQRKRLSHLALTLDCEMCPAFGCNPQMSYTRLATCLPCPENVWSASSALDWALVILQTGILERAPDATCSFFLSQDHFPPWIESVFEATFLLSAAVSTVHNRSYVLGNAGPSFDPRDKEPREQRSVLCWSWHQAFQGSFRDAGSLGSSRAEIRYHSIMLHHSNVNTIVLRLGAGQNSEVGPFHKVTPAQTQYARAALRAVSQRTTGGFACVHAVGVLKVALNLTAGEATGDPYIAWAVYNAALAIWHFATGPLDHSPPLTKPDRLCMRLLSDGQLYVEPSLAKRRAQLYIEQYEPFIHPFQPGLCGVAPSRSYCVGLIAWAYMFLDEPRRPALSVARKTLLDLIMTCEL